MSAAETLVGAPHCDSAPRFLGVVRSIAPLAAGLATAKATTTSATTPPFIAPTGWRVPPGKAPLSPVFRHVAVLVAGLGRLPAIAKTYHLWYKFGRSPS